MPRVVGSDGRSIPLSMFNATSMPSEGSLGSNYTEDEERYVEELTRHTSPSQARSYHSAHQQPPRRNENRALQPHTEEPTEGHDTLQSDSGSIRPRLDPGRDLIHVPQMADKRYSWEND
ncbi:hamartin [Purpureocillium lavendulum]|uniref:Hamartin n=1 Tax=Purpureocillium lavendulum TaxID=1247861 RepID=A0AB34FY62_9HYPO|nr:hamartin [Purpureocillium lavendulum]